MTTKLTQNDVLTSVKKAYGFVPNLMQEMSNAPAIVEIYLAGMGALAKGTFSQREQQTIMLAVSARNACHYCTAVHRTIGASAKVAQSDLDAIDGLELPEEPRLRALTEATWLLQEKQGWVGEEDLQALEAKGVSKAEVYEIIGILALKTLTNYVNHIAGTEIDAPFAAQATRTPNKAA